MSIFQNGWWATGFDMDLTAAQLFTLNQNGSAVTSPTPFSFGYSWQANNLAGISFGANLTTLWNGFRYYATALPGTSGIIAQWYDVTANAVQVSLRIFADGHFQFYLGNGTGTTIGSASATGLIAINTFVHLQTKMVIGASGAGSLTLYVNGSATAAITATGVTTQSTANTWVSGFQFNSATGANYNVDDWWMLDNSGSAPFNTYLGIIQVREEAPSANSGVTGGRNNFTPTNPTNVNWSNVGTTPAVATKYNADGTVGDWDMFVFPPLPSNVASVLAVTALALLLLDAAGARTVALNCSAVSGGTPTDSLGSAFTPATSATLYMQNYPLDPHSASWTVANAGSAELGLKVAS
jgi:hypothetical protein